MSKQAAEALLNDLLPFAKQMLAEYGDFHPFGGYLDAKGETIHVGAGTDTAGAKGKIELLESSFKRLALSNEATAAAIVYEVTRPFRDGTKGDAIKVEIEHKDGYSASVFFRYVVSDGKVSILDTIAQRRDLKFFV